MDGEVDTFPTSDPAEVREPLDRLMPVTGSLGLRWESDDSRYWWQGRLLFADDQSTLSTRDRNDTSRIPPGGTPDFQVIHLGGGYRFRDGMTVTVAIDNLLDADYRVHGSGTNMPGRNFIAILEMEF